MGVNKNFVVKYGLEVGLSTDGLQYAVLADYATRNVGIGTSVPKYKLHVSGGIGATFLNVAGISSVVDIRGTRLNYSGIGTIATFNATNAYVDTGITTTLSGVALNYSGISTIQLCSGDSVVYRQGYVNVGLVTNLRGTNVEYIGIATFNQTYINTGVSTDHYIFREYTQTGIVTTLTGTNLNYTGVGTITALRGTNINYSGISTFTTIDGTTADFNTLYSNTGIVTTIGITTANITAANITNSYINNNYNDVGIVTTLTGTNLNFTGVGTFAALRGTNLNYTGVSTITTLDGTTADFNTLYSNTGIVTTIGITTANITNSYINNNYNDVGIVTTLTGTNLNYTGVGTFAALRGTNINYSGISTFTTIDGTTADFNTLYSNTGIVTTIGITTANITNAYVQTNYVNLGIITAIQGTNINVGGITTSNSYNIGANQVISSARQLQNIVSVDATTNSTILSVVGGGVVTGQTVTGVATFSNGPVLIGTGTSTGTVGQILQVAGINSSVYFGGTLGIGATLINARLQVVPTASQIAGLFTGTSSVDMVRITQLGTGNALVVQDEADPDSTPTVIDASGNIGVGTDTPQDRLHVQGVMRFDRRLGPADTAHIRYFRLGTEKARFGLLGADDAIYFNATTTDTANHLVIKSSGNVGLGMSLPTSVLHVTGNAVVTGIMTANTFSGSGASLNSIPNGALTNSTISGISLGSNLNTLTINSTYLTGTSYNGNAAVTLNINATSANTGSYVVARDSGGGFNAGIITCTDLNSTSDINLKANVKPIENALQIATSLEGVRFEWKDNNKPSIGVIAQQIEEVLPELVSTAENKTVNYNGLIGVLIEAIKELKAEVDELKANMNK